MSRIKGVIYGLVCECSRCDGAVRYVGQTTQGVQSRLNAHRSVPSRERHTLKGRWIKKHGPGNVKAVVLETNPEDGLDAAEVRWIKSLNTLAPLGLNMTPGGYDGSGRPGEDNPGARLTQSQVVEIIERIGTEPTQTSRSLASEYGVTKTLILKIDQGSLWPELPRPHGTRVLGARSSKKPMTAEKVRQIRKDGERNELTRYEIADRNGVSYAAVSNILAGRTWRGVT